MPSLRTRFEIIFRNGIRFSKSFQIKEGCTGIPQIFISIQGMMKNSPNKVWITTARLQLTSVCFESALGSISDTSMVTIRVENVWQMS